MARRRVLFISHGHAGERPAGAENYALELHTAMRGSGSWEPVLLARTGPPHSPSHPTSDGPRVHPFDGRPDEFLIDTQGYDFDWLLGTIRHDKRLYTEDLRRFLERVQPDVVHFQHTLFLGYDAIREVRRTLPDAAIVLTLHEFLAICHHKGQMVRTMDGSLCDRQTAERCHECFPDISPEAFLLRSRFVRAQLDLVDLFVAPSAVVRDRFVEWGIPPDRILLEDYGRCLPPPGDHARPAPHRVLGFYGQLNPFKGIDVLLEAMARLGDEADGAARPCLRVHGTNLDLQERGFADRLAALRERCDGSVEWCGPYAPERAGELIAAVDWVVVPSVWWENSPLVIQEAFARQRPVICSDIGGMAEKVAHEVDGLHFAAGDAAALAATIRRAVSDEGLWERLQEGISAVHSMDEHVATLGAAYERILARRPERRAA